MRDQEGIRSTFTTIYHDKRIELGLNLTEYVLLDTIHILSQDRKGYCYKSLRSLARDLGMTPSGMHSVIQRLIDRELLIKYKDGYKTSQAFIETVYLQRVRKSYTNSSNRSKIERSVRKSNASVRKSDAQQMLDIHKNNNRNTHGTPRENPRVPEQAKPLSEAAKRLQARLDKIRKHDAA